MLRNLLQSDSSHAGTGSIAPPSTLPAACVQGSAPAGAGGEGHSELAQALMLFIPTAFDLIATVLMNVGLLSGGRWPHPRLTISLARHA